MGLSKSIVIIGAGPGGYVAAIRAAQLGAQVTVIENQALGGVCLNAGCIPSKALLATVELGEKLRMAKDFGIRVEGNVDFDLARMVGRKNQIVGTLQRGIVSLFKSWNITHIPGTGKLRDARTVQVIKADGSEINVSADAIIIATGSSWPNLPQFPVDGKTILTSKEALDLDTVPAKLLIVGGGVEGCEFAALFSGLGSQVMVVEMMDRILPLEDEEISRFIARELKKRKVELHAGTTIQDISTSPGVVKAKLSSSVELQAEKVLVSVGRRFHTQGIGLEQVGVGVGSHREIEVDGHCQTTVTGIFAIGDVVGKAMLAHVASAQGKIAVENIMGNSKTINYSVIPAGIFTLPEIGRVGLTEQEVGERGMRAKIGRFRYASLGKAYGVGETTGMFKVLADEKTDMLLGVHIVGAHAADLIHEAALAMEVQAPARSLAGMIHAHPTVSEGLMEAAEDLEALAIHQGPKKA